MADAAFEKIVDPVDYTLDSYGSLDFLLVLGNTKGEAYLRGIPPAIEVGKEVVDKSMALGFVHFVDNCLVAKALLEMGLMAVEQYCPLMIPSFVLVGPLHLLISVIQKNVHFICVSELDRECQNKIARFETYFFAMLLELPLDC